MREERGEAVLGTRDDIQMTEAEPISRKREQQAGSRAKGNVRAGATARAWVGGDEGEGPPPEVRRLE
jgi:hypothetical protein